MRFRAEFRLTSKDRKMATLLFACATSVPEYAKRFGAILALHRNAAEHDDNQHIVKGMANDGNAQTPAALQLPAKK